MKSFCLAILLTFNCLLAAVTPQPYTGPHLVIHFSESQKNEWELGSQTIKEDGQTFEVWFPRPVAGKTPVDERLILVTVPWGHENNVPTIQEAIQALLTQIPSAEKGEVFSQSGNEAILLWRMDVGYILTRLVVTPYGLFTATYSYKGKGEFDINRWIDFLQNKIAIEQ